MPEKDSPSGRVAGKVALVTGAASGIGRATALLLACEGARVAVTDLDESACRQVAAEFRGGNAVAIAHKLDVTQEADWVAAVGEVIEKWGSLQILVANAGISAVKPIVEMELNEWGRVMAVNLDGVFLGIKHVAGAMKSSGGGSIVVVSSASALRAAANTSAYGASKAAVRHLAKTAALELGPGGIRVNCVLPGGVETPMWSGQEMWEGLLKKFGSEKAVWKALGEGTPLKRFAKPEEIAETILYLASDESAFITGTDLVIDGGYTA
jgi:3(or 17)beta-hydroxysteroid dehydrogenase